MIDQSFNIDSLPDVPLVDRGYGYEVGTELFLVRHGESMTNTYANLVAYDPNLTALGWAQALRAGDWMAKHTPVDVVVTSPMRRAHSTALAIAQAQGLELVQLPGLEEFSHSFWEEVPEHHPTRPWWGRTDWIPTLEQAPIFAAFRERVLQALVEILERYSGQRICVVSHGGTMSILTAAMLGSVHFSIWNTNTGISQFMWPEWKRWMVHYLNRTEHLLDLNPADYPRAPEACQNELGFWKLPDRVVDSWTPSRRCGSHCEHAAPTSYVTICKALKSASCAGQCSTPTTSATNIFSSHCPIPTNFSTMWSYQMIARYQRKSTCGC